MEGEAWFLGTKAVPLKRRIDFMFIYFFFFSPSRLWLVAPEGGTGLSSLNFRKEAKPISLPAN